MFRFLTLTAVLSFSLAGAAVAQPIPPEVLDADFQSCLGGLPPQQDAQRTAYCNCVRDGMRGWDLETYSAIAQQAQGMTAQNAASAAPAALNTLAQGCIAKVLK